MNNNELTHYGVLGMKWGVRKGDVGKAYGKATKKFNKLDTKVVNAERKANKAMYKVDKKAGRIFSSRRAVSKASSKAGQKQARATRQIYKAHKWYKAMEDTFSQTTQKMSKAQIEKGKEWASKLNASRASNAIAYKQGLSAYGYK